MIKVSAELFALSYEAVSSEETRYYLNGVFVQPHHDNGAFLVSTDGHRMVVVHDATAEVSQSAIITLPKFAVQQLAPRKGFRLETKSLVVDVDAKTATLVAETANKEGMITRTENIVTAHNVIIDGTFPDWKKVCPKGEMESAGVVGMNSRYVASMGKFGTKFDSPNRGGMYFMKPKAQDAGGPVMIRWGNVHHVFAVVMPFRTDIELSVPAFFGEVDPK